MAITNYLVHFKTEATYESNKDQLRNDAVAFVKDATIIHTHGTDYYCGSGPVALESDLANYATTEALTSGLADKADVSHTHTISQISGLQGELDSKLESVSLADLGVTATATELNYVDGVTSNIQTQLNNKAASSHEHAASAITSGTLSLDRLPSITDAKITSISASKITGTIPQANLPSYVDDVLEYSSKSSFPQTGEAGKIYVDTTTNLTYRWGGSSYVEISPSLALGETSSTAYRGDRGKIAYDHSQATGNPHGLTLSNLGISATAAELNYMDGVTSNVQTQLNGKAASSHTHTASQVSGLATVATSGSYNDLSNKPTIPSLAGYATQTWVSSQIDAITPASIGAAASSHSHSNYVQKSGDKMTGTLTVSKLGIGTSNPTRELHVAGSARIDGWIYLYNATGWCNFTYGGGIYMTDSTYVRVYNGKAFYVANNIVSTGQVSATNGFYETSDARLKNFKDDIKALDVISEIPTKYFTWKKDEESENTNSELHIGTSAQEIKKLYPDLVTENEEGELLVDYAKLSIIALAAIKELKEEIKTLKVN